MSSDLARATLAAGSSGLAQMRTIAAIAAAGFRRYATYRQATAASTFTNTVFGFLRSYVLLAAVAGTGVGVAAGYDAERIATYTWVSQGLIGMVMLWGFSELGDRIRSGEVVADLLRPVHPLVAYLAADLGRAAHASLTRLLVPVVVGAIFFDLYTPAEPLTYPLFVASALLGVLVCFGCRYLINAAAYWLLEIRGVTMVWTFATGVLSGLAFPLHFLPSWLTWALWVATPFPSILQAPLDVVVERGSLATRLGLVAGQAGWVVVMLAIGWYVQRRAERKLVIQGG
ncbi:MAG TPA: ABC-2 family transporter protein [Micromonosporaceae bacterium]